MHWSNSKRCRRRPRRESDKVLLLSQLFYGLKIMKEKKLDDMLQLGYLISMILAIIFALAGLWLDNEFLIWLTLVMLLYIPAMVCVYCIQASNDSYKKWKKKRRKEKRLAECTSFRCKTCNQRYRKEELDISATSVPRCPQCNKKLIPID
jgi:hypothetical protein